MILVLKSFGKPEVDHFVSQINAKCTKCVNKGQINMPTNLMHFQWVGQITDLKPCISPPFIIIGNVRAKLVQDPAEAIAVVTYTNTVMVFAIYLSDEKRNKTSANPSSTASSLTTSVR